MADISQIKTPNGNTYNIKDETARNSISGLAPKASPTFTGTPTAPTASAETNDTQIATTAFVHSVMSANDAMVFKGTIGTGGTVTTLPTTHKKGWTYKVITAGTYAGKTCEIGDMIICVTDGTAASNDHWTVVQSNIDGAVTGPTSAVDARVAVFNGTSGKVIKDSGFTIGKSVPSNAVFTDNDTKNTAGSTDTSSKIFLIGATSQGANPQTYSQDTAYVGTDGCLYSGGVKVLTSHQDISGKVSGPSTATASDVAVFDGTTGKVIKDSGFTIGKSVPSDAVFTDTTYESKAAASGGTALSLVTTGEKATWNAKTSNTGTLTGITMNGSSKGTSGVVNLGTVVTAVTFSVDESTGVLTISVS